MNKSSWVIYGGIVIGLGAGLFQLLQSPLAFVSIIILGLAIGLIFSAVLSKFK
ncbi:hypothetical protein [Gramella sp. AN32]|uniref:Uncharacterized protein n=1 Tax=Christiangramia antarctica TaxID=2058158 RepID=A0ABW5X5P7_9FLAO|nr:hypothetical protein [Gramella sp. AN32]